MTGSLGCAREVDPGSGERSGVVLVIGVPRCV